MRENHHDDQTDQNVLRHFKTKKRLKTAGWILLCVGIVLSLTGLISFFSSINSGDMPGLFWCCFIGFPLLAAGGGLLGFAYKREIGGYVANESAPVVNEFASQVTPAIETVTKAVTDAKYKSDAVRCPQCGASNSPRDSFCGSCGHSLSVVCPECGRQTEGTDKFCRGCGKRL